LKSVLVIGATGQLGTALCKQLVGKYNVYGTFVDRRAFKKQRQKGIEYVQASLTDFGSMEYAFATSNPDIVILTAAMTHVDNCEEEKELCKRINIKGVEKVAELCKNKKLIFISTYYMYEGNKEDYKETDKVKPLNYYSESKLQGEKIVGKLKDYIIVRTAKIYSLGYDSRNFIARLISKVKNREEMKIPYDQGTNPVLADDLAKGIMLLLDKKGVYNIGGDKYISNYDFAKQVLKKLKLNIAYIKPVSTASLQQAAKRPLKSGLSIEKIEKLGFKPTSFDNALLLIKQRFEK